MLSTEDRIAIQDLYSRYCACADLNDSEGWSRCFTEDGIMGAKKETRGRANLAARLLEMNKYHASEPYKNPQHWMGNIQVDGDGDTASSFCYCYRIARHKETNEMVFTTQSFWEDKLRKVNGQWLFASRRAHFDTPSPSIIPGKR